MMGVVTCSNTPRPHCLVNIGLYLNNCPLLYTYLAFLFSGSRFIGELFKLKMLTETIMHDCVYKLLRSGDAENLECLCTLLTIIGKELDVPKAKVS